MRVAVLLFPGFQALDVMGPIDVFSEGARQAGRSNTYSFELIAMDPGPLTASNGLPLHPTCTIDNAPDDIDTLLVAGSPSIESLDMPPRLLDWLRQRSTRVRRLGSVCTGTFALARAGLLDGRRVTTHWNSSERLARRYPLIRVEQDQIYIRDGSVYTSAGVSAGMDLALALVEEDLGREVAMKAARELVMFLKRPGGQSQFSAHLAAQTAERDAIRDVQAWVLENLGQDLHVEQLATRAGMSVRTFTRQFKQDTGVTPADFVEGARIDAARRLLEDTANPLKRIAAWSGFGGPNGLRRAFMRRLGISPVDYRSRFQ